jgi:hypothetical protein
MFPELTPEQVEYVTQEIRNWVGRGVVFR